jgi:mRNA interferase MazF
LQNLITDDQVALLGAIRVLLPQGSSGLPRDSVANVSQIFTVDKTFLVERIGSLPDYLQEEVDEGLRTILYL